MADNSDPAWKSRDYFAEMYIAGLMADAGWNIYFPRRDQGFDMVATYPDGANVIVRPVQVKGKYPTEGKTDKSAYGYIGGITAFHDDMILAIPLFGGLDDPAPRHIAWMPRPYIRSAGKRGWRCVPARFAGGVPVPRQSFLPFFDAAGLLRCRGPMTALPGTEDDIECR